MARPALLLTGAAVALTLAWTASAGGWQPLLRHWSAAPFGPAAFTLAGAALCAVGMPRQLVAGGAGYAFGLPLGVALSLAAQLLGCALDLFWARLLARKWVARRFAARLARIDRVLADSPLVATLALRLLPVGNNLLLNLAAGASPVPAGRFLLGSAVGYLPQTLVFVLLGTGVRLDRGAELAAWLVMLAASAAFAGLLTARARRGVPAGSLAAPAPDANSAG